MQALIGVGVGGIIYRYGCIRRIICTGMALTTLGFGLFITFGTKTTLTGLIAIEIVAAMGIGAVFQAPLVAYQATVDAADMAMATALFGFVRSLSTSISLVMGGIVFQNAISAHSSMLKAVLGDPSLVQDFSAINATSSVTIVQTLPSLQQMVVKDAYVASLRDMWKMYAGISACGLVAALFMLLQSRRTDQSDGISTADSATIDANEVALSTR